MLSHIATKLYVTTYKAHIPNIHALNSDTHTLRIQYEYTQKQCVGVAIEGMDIWYMGLINIRKYHFLDPRVRRTRLG